MIDQAYSELQSLDVEHALWERFYTVAPLVIVGTVDASGKPDLAPKHMAFPLGWQNYFGFVCSPSHTTYQNARNTGAFTVSYPRHDDIVASSLTASPRQVDEKPILGLLETFPAQRIDGPFIKKGYLFLECKLIDTFDGFGDNSLVAGKVVAAHADPAALRQSDRDDVEVLLDVPQLAYLYPGRFAVISETQAFPFPTGMRR